MPYFFKNKYQNFSEVLIKYFSSHNESKSLKPLSEILFLLKKQPFVEFLSFLKSNPTITNNFGHYIRKVFDKRFNLSLTEADILSENAFVPELKKRLLNQVLPPVDYDGTIWQLVDTVSVRPSQDLKYFKAIPEQELDELFKILKIDTISTQPKVKRELLFSMNILSWRTIGNTLEIEVVNMAPQYKNFDNPFLALQKELEILLDCYSKNPDYTLHSKNENYKQIKVYLQQCLEFVDLAFKNSSKYGISGKINQSLLKIRQQVVRMSDILYVLVQDSDEDALLKSQKLFFDILEYKSRKNNIGDLFSDSTRLMSHLITNHTAETGSQYITSSFKEYLKMFWKASGGGVIVGALCVLKMLYSYIPGSDFSHAVLYSFNYAMGFIMIYLMNFTLATKQPAMTAATMAKVLSEDQNHQRNYQDFANLVSKLFRSQFIAFVGNVLWAFPVSLAIIYGLDVLLSQNFAVEKSTKLLTDLNPFESKAILHASIAGFYLFISGIISGNVGNNSVYYKIPKRIAKNPFMNQFFGEKFTKRLSVFYSRNWAGIVSNFWFGVCLGATAPIGLFLGLDIDIRHITFAAGNFALGLYGKDFNISNSTFLISFFTVFLIGFFNFLVSFGLSMFLAFRSRKVRVGEVKLIFKEIFRYFLKNPLRFFFPIRSFLDSRAKEMVQKTVSKNK